MHYVRHSATTPAVCGSLISSGFAMRCSDNPAGREAATGLPDAPAGGSSGEHPEPQGHGQARQVRQALKAIEKLEGLGE